MLGSLVFQGLFSQRFLVMPNHTRMKRFFLDGARWLFLLQYGFMVLSLEAGFLDFDNLPDTNFTCHGKVIGGYYADIETNCQMFHVCTKGQADESMDIRFLCLNGTVFDQETRVCERIDEVDCSKSEQFYSLNLELYQHSAPNSEDNPEVPQETEQPHAAKSTTTAPTTTTKTAKPSHYFTTPRLVGTTTTTSAISGHHFPVNTPDIRFNPEEINISLNAGAPPDIRTNHFQSHHNFDDVTDSDEQQSVRLQKPERTRISASSTPTSIFAIQDSDSNENSDISFGFSDEEFRATEHSRQPQFLIQTNSFRHSQSFPPSANQYHFRSTTPKQNYHQEASPSYTTSRTIYLNSLKSPHRHYANHHPRTEKTPQRVQIPIPVLPTLPPLTFSSPAPFSLQHHIENKRYTKDHPSPPRIIISASASVSDASGRRLNYSLGTIGAAQILDNPPTSYDEYKDSDVSLDPFYHDVPKIKRKKRSIDDKKQLNPFEVIRNEKEAVEVLKFLFNWYQSHQATATVPPATSPVSLDLIRKINDELAPPIKETLEKSESSEVYFASSKEDVTEGIKNSGLFKVDSKFNILNGHDFGEDSKNVHDKSKTENVAVSEEKGTVDKNAEGVQGKEQKHAEEVVEKSIKIEEKMDIGDFARTPLKRFNPEDYVDDNFEPIVYKQHDDEKVILKESPKGFKPSNQAPIGAYELYTYVNIKNQLTTPPITTTELDLLQIPQKNSSETDKHTEINIISQIREEIGPQPSSLTTEVSSSRHPRRRNRGRQRHVDNYQEASYTSNQVNNVIDSNKRTRGRGRSRFREVSSTTSSATENVPLHHQLFNTEVLSTLRIDVDVSPRGVEANEVIETSSQVAKVVTSTEKSIEMYHPPVDIFSGRDIDFEINKTLDKSTTYIIDTNDVTPSTLNFTTTIHGIEIFNSTFSNDNDLPETEFANVDPKVDSVVLDLIHHQEEPHHTTDAKSTTASPIPEYIHHQEESHQTTESESTTISTIPESIDHHYQAEEHRSETPESTIVTPESIDHHDQEEQHQSTTLESTTAFRTSESVHHHHHHHDEDFVHPSTASELTESTLSKSTQPSISTSSDPSYLVKLLKYFADSDTIYAPITDLPKVSYEPLTENYMTSIPYFVTPVTTSREETTSEIFATKTLLAEEAENKESLLEKLSKVQHSLEGSKSIIDDTTATTPLINFEDKLSFGTTFETTTLNSTYSSSSIKAENYRLYDDVFAVPELSEANTEPSTKTTLLNESTFTTSLEDHTETTLLPTVEIEKSVSFPVTILDSNLNNPHVINDLVESTTPQPKFLLSTEVTSISTEKYFETTSISPSNRPPQKVNSSHLFQVLLETTTTSPVTTTIPTITSKRTRPPRRRPESNPRNLLGKHRFNTELVSRRATEAPLLKSASPTKTRSELAKMLLHTTPLSKNHFSPKMEKNYVFNCFGKETNRFYADPRDCRLFHYCTQGYSKNQLLDLKYVCDQRTFFDEDKLICTKVKPAKCL
ncbi:mucin-4-like [Euwallacea similis]|uniref:mucin-4-like n=1 Tax=Euwallacea similis TaxID=1736056 RepID=UPI00344C10EE